MILDFLSQCTSIVKVFQYSSVNDQLLTNNYNIKSSGLAYPNWKLTDNTVTSVEFRFISPTTKILKSIEGWQPIGGLHNANINVIIDVSLNYSDWYELKYKTNVTDNPDDKYLYAKTTNGYINLTTKKVEDIIPLDSFEASKLVYTFTKINEFSKQEEDLYTDLEFKHIRVRLVLEAGTLDFGVSEEQPLYFPTFNITIDDTFDTDLLDTNLLEIKSNIFTKQKIYEEVPFFNDMIKSYLKMLEENVTPLKHMNKSLIDIVVQEPTGVGLEYGVNFDEIEVSLVVY